MFAISSSPLEEWAETIAINQSESDPLSLHHTHTHTQTDLLKYIFHLIHDLIFISDFFLGGGMIHGADI